MRRGAVTVARVWACGVALEASAGGALSCPGCGAEARCWAVVLDGERVGAGGRGEAFVSADHLRRMGITDEMLATAEAADAEAGE